MTQFTLTVEPHPLLRVAAFASHFAQPVGEVATPASVTALLDLNAPAPLQRDDAVRTAIRDMLRIRGYKPTGRGKPASEYLLRAATEGALSPINAAVDACNAASLHSGFPISVVDLDLALAPYRIAVAPQGAAFVFNRSEQVIELGGLPCLHDAEGPCANAVRDAQRTKTGPSTRGTLSVIWGCVEHEERLHETARWYRDLLSDCGATTDDVVVDREG